RFIWVKDVTAPVSSTNLRVFRFTRVPFGIQDNIYMDNVFLTAYQIPAAIEKGQEAKSVFKEADMNLREFRSNSREVLSALNKDSDSLQQMVFNTKKCDNWPQPNDSFSHIQRSSMTP
uniref:Uncharacterized protein n=1 Tax=Parascaris equorum TaxID=6256 RepID=A0A914R8L9_PAREQ